MADSYLTFAADYDWLFDDDVLTDGGAINHPAAARLLQRTGPGRTVLDASCGTGINAAALARRGFDVWATDGSEAMITEATARFRREQLAIPVRHSLWADLPPHPGRTLRRRALRRELAGPRRGPGRHGGGPHRAEADGQARGARGDRLAQLGEAARRTPDRPRRAPGAHPGRPQVPELLRLGDTRTPARRARRPHRRSSSRTPNGSRRTSTRSRSAPSPSPNCANGSSSPG